MMRPVQKREEYLQLRGCGRQHEILSAVRGGDESRKKELVQFAYSCLPNPDGTLKGSRRLSTTIGMDIDHVPPEELQPMRERILAKKEELGLRMLEESARGQGYHLVFDRRAELSQEQNLEWASQLLGVEFDKGAKDITRVFFTTTERELLYLDDRIFEIAEAPSNSSVANSSVAFVMRQQDDLGICNPHGIANADTTSSCITNAAEQGAAEQATFPDTYHGIPFAEILNMYWRVNNRGFEPNQGDRDTLTFQLASDLRHICGKNFQWLDQVIPCYDGFPLEEKRQKIRNALASKYEGFPQRLRDTLNALNGSVAAPSNRSVAFAMRQQDNLGICNPHGITNADIKSSCITNAAEQGGGAAEQGAAEQELNPKKLPQGVRDSIAAVGPQLAMPVVTAICPCIGALATGVRLDVHGQKRGLNLIAYIAGDFASRKGDIDPVVNVWMSEIRAVDEMYLQQEADFRRKKNAAKNQKTQPEEPKLPVRYVTLNTTVANLAERLGNVGGKHAFSFTPEADTVAQKWRSTMCDFSVMLRQSYDGSRYDREARSSEAVNVHIEHLLWNVTMCGTPDALYRVVTNYTDGFQSRIALAQTPDNTFAQLEDNPYVLTSRQTERIQQIAHLLPLMQGEVVLPKLEARGREWLEKIRLEAMKNDDRVKARERFRTCVTTQRMVCCLMLCRVCEQLIQKHGLSGAEALLKQKPDLWKEMLLKAQTPALLDTYDVIADSLLTSALYFFRERIEAAFRSRNYAGNLGERRRVGKNDSIYERLDAVFSFEQAVQQSVALKGADVTRNSVQQMLKNWRNQGLVELTDDARYRKQSTTTVISQ